MTALGLMCVKVHGDDGIFSKHTYIKPKINLSANYVVVIMSTKKVAITFLPPNHRKMAKEKYTNMMNEYYDRMPELSASYEDEYNYENNQKRREHEAFEEKFWIKWNKHHAPQQEDKQSTTFEPFIGPENQTHIWQDEDGYTVYSTKSQIQQKIEASREEARIRKARKAEERIMLANKCKR